MSEQFAFHCRSGGLGSSLRESLLGGYSSDGSWSIYVTELEDADEHMVVQVHEALHHELQISTTWGQIGALSALLAARGRRPLALAEVFDHSVVHSTAVHESYATFLSDRTVRDRTGRDVLQANVEYKAYRARAEALVPAMQDVPEGLHQAAVAAVLRAMMQPAGLADLVSSLNFNTLRAVDLRRLVPETPDARLTTFERMKHEQEWEHLLRDLTKGPIDHQGRILREKCPTEQSDLDLLKRQWEFEVQVVQRSAYDLAARTLGRAGEGCLDWDSLSEVAGAVVSAAIEAEPSLAELLRHADGMPLPDTDVLEFARQRIVLRDRLPVEAVGGGAATVMRAIDGFVAQAGTDDEHVLAIWTDRGFLRKQFQWNGEGDEATTVLFVRARDASGNPVARVGDLGGIADPRAVQEQLGPTPLLA